MLVIGIIPVTVQASKHDIPCAASHMSFEQATWCCA